MDTWTPTEGDFAQRHDGRSNVHIVHTVREDELVIMYCRQAWYLTALRHVDGDRPKQCQRCWNEITGISW